MDESNDLDTSQPIDDTAADNISTPFVNLVTWISRLALKTPLRIRWVSKYIQQVNVH